MIRRRVFLFGVLTTFAFCLFARAEETLLYKKKSEFNDIYVTQNEKGLRTLWFEEWGHQQSVVKLGDPDFIDLEYARVMPLGFTMVEEPKRVLIVGLGGGTLPMFYRKHYPQMKIDVVDLDPEVINVAKNYFGFKEDDNMKAYAKDGRKFIEDAKEPYDIIFLDAFSADSIPYDLVTREFLQAVKKALGPKGVAVSNLWELKVNPFYYSMIRTYQDVFDDVCTVDVKHDSGNIILMASPRKDELKKDDLVARAKKIVADKKYPMKLDEYIADGYKHEVDKDPKAIILLDKDKKKNTEPPKEEKKAA
jgi:spermidine synthase